MSTKCEAKVLTEQLGDGENDLELMHFTALRRAGVWNQELLLREIDRHTFSWVVTEFPVERLP